MKKTVKNLAALTAMAAGVLSLSGCVNTVQPIQPDKHTESSSTERLVQAQYPVKAYKTDEERREGERQLRLDSEFVEKVNAFSYDSAVRILADTESNGLYSPLSLYVALSMAAAGAEGKTAQELLTLLDYEDKEDLNAACSHALTSFYQDEEMHKLQLSSSLWAAKTVEWKKPFLKTMGEEYFADIYKTDFSDPQTGSDMGEWVKERTKGLIEPSIQTSPQQILALMNTIYYYDEWQDQFPIEQTKQGTFTKADGQEVTCDYMNGTMGSHGYHRGEDYTVSSLGCKNGSVVFLLPDPGVGLEKFLKKPEVLQEALNGDMTMGQVVWQVPKFSYGSSYSLQDALKDMGISAAFSPEKADFGAMTDSAAWIDSVIQQNHISVDENGIEAASFTMIGMAVGAMPRGRAEMILNRPFLYVVKNKSCPVFIGICGDPTGWFEAG